MSEKEILENILTAQVLILSKQIKASKKREGFYETQSDEEKAIHLIQKEKPEILSALKKILD